MIAFSRFFRFFENRQIDVSRISEVRLISIRNAECGTKNPSRDPHVVLPSEARNLAVAVRACPERSRGGRGVKKPCRGRGLHFAIGILQSLRLRSGQAAIGSWLPPRTGFTMRLCARRSSTARAAAGEGGEKVACPLFPRRCRRREKKELSAWTRKSFGNPARSFV